MSDVTITYVTVSERTPDQFDVQVNKYLSLGYTLYGDPYLHVEYAGVGQIYDFWCQALIKTDPKGEKQ